MADNLNIIIRAILEKTSKEQIVKEIDEIQRHINKTPLRFKIDVDNEEFKKFSKNMDDLAKKVGINFDSLSKKSVSTIFDSSGVEKSRVEVEQLTNSIGDLIKVTKKYSGTEETSTKIDVSENYDKQRKSLEKLNAEQSKYWSQRAKETIASMTQKPDALIKMANYYKELEISSSKYAEQLKKVNAEQSKYWSQRVKETVSAMTQKPDELIKMADYYKELENSSAKYTQQVYKNQLAQKDLLDSIRGLRGKDGAFIIDDNLKNLNKLEDSIRKLDPTSKDFTNNMKSAKSELKEINTTTSIYKKQVQEASKYTNIFGQSLFEAGKKFGGWMLIATAIMAPIRALREGLTTLKEIDTELINIAKVTDYTNEEMKKLVNTSVSMGAEFGRTAQEYLQSVTEFARAGFGQRAEEYAKLSLLLQNVGDVNAQVANETLLSADAGFQLKGSYESLLGIIDKFNNVSNRNATTVTKMSDAMKVGASVFHSAGMTIDETIAIIGTATTATQRSGSEISRAWRTILMNVRQVADEEAEVTEESMKKAEKALNSVGIVVRDSPSTFRPMFEIIRDLGEKWENLSQVEQAYVAESLAGKRQANVLIATLQNWDIAEKQLIESIEASGSAMQENEVYMQSWEAKAKQLSANMSMFWTNLINTDLIKTFFDFMNGLVVVMDKLVNNSFSGFLLQTTILTGAIKGLALMFNMLKASTLGTSVGVIALDIAEKGLIVTTRALTTTLLASPLFWTVVASAGLVGVVKLVDKLNVSFKEQQEIVANLNSEINSLGTEYEQLISKDNRTPKEEKYLELLRQELDVKKELLKIETQKELEKEFFESNLTSNGLMRLNDEIERYNALQNDFDNAKSLTERDKFEEKLLKTKQSLIETQKSLENYKNKLGEIPSVLEDFMNVLDGILGKQDETSSNTKKVEESVSNLNSAITNITTTTGEYFDSIKGLSSAYADLTDGQDLSLETVMNLLEKHPELISSLQVENGQLVLNKDAVYTLMKAKEDEAKTSLRLKQQEVEENAKAVMEQLNQYGVLIQSLDQVQQAKKDLMADPLTQGMGSTTAAYLQLSSLEKYANQIEQYKKVINTDWTSSAIKSASSKTSNKPQTLDPTQSLINQINLQSELTKSKNETLKKEIDLAKSVQDHNRQLELTSSLIKGQQTEISDLTTANSKLSAEMKKLGNANWLDQNGEETLEYIRQYNSSSQKQQQAIKETFDKLQKLKKAWIENNKNISTLNASVVETTKSLIDIQKAIEDLNFTRISDTYTKTLDDFELKLRQLDFTDMFLNEDDIASKTKIIEQKMEVLLSQITSIQKNIKSINSMDISKSQKENLFKQWSNDLESAVKSYVSLQDSLAKNAQKKLDIVRDVEKTIMDMIRKGYEEELKLEENIHKKKLDNLKKQKDAFNEIINTKIKSLELEKETNNYNDELNKIQSERNSLQEQYDALLLDNSYSSQLQRADLQKQIANKDKELQEKIYNHGVEYRKKSLENELNLYNKAKDKEIESEEGAYNNYKELMERKMQDENLYFEARTKLSRQSTQSLINDIIAYTNRFGDGMSLLGNSIKENLINNLRVAVEEFGNIAKLVEQANSPNMSNTIIDSSLDTISKPPTYSAKRKVYGNEIDLANAISILGTKDFEYVFNINPNMNELSSGDIIVGGNGVFRNWDELRKNNDLEFLFGDNREETKDAILKWKKLKGYRLGGINTSPGVAELHGTKSSPEVIFNSTDAGKLFNFVKNLPIITQSDILKSFKPPSFPIPQASLAGVGDINIQLTVEGNLDEKVLPNIKSVLSDSSRLLKKELNKMGIHRK